MDANFEYFEKFIIKQIVNTVAYNPETDEYEINRIHISDDIIRTIEEEGKRYELQRQQIHQIIFRISENIRMNPSAKLRYDSIDVGKLKIGQHFRINILHVEKGMHYLELLVADSNHFFVLTTDISGISYGDELHALDKTWNNAYYIDFMVFRGPERIPNGKTILRLGKIVNIEMYSPSVVNEILDSESTFTYDSIKPQEVKKIIDKNKERSYFFWMPNKWKPITFCWKEGDIQNDTSTFIITDNEESTEAKIMINKAFVLSQETEHLDAFMEIFFDCCNWENAFSGVENLKYIKSVKAGVVKKNKSDLDSKEWELISQPQIKFVYE